MLLLNHSDMYLHCIYMIKCSVYAMMLLRLTILIRKLIDMHTLDIRVQKVRNLKTI